MSATAAVGRFGIIGSIVGFLALVMAVLPLWILPAVFPPKPLDQIIVDTAQKVKERVVAKTTGVQYQAPAETDDRAAWYRACSIAAVAFGLVALGFAAWSVLRREPWRYAGVAATLGAGAIAFEAVLFALCVVVGVLLVVAILDYLGVSL